VAEFVRGCSEGDTDFVVDCSTVADITLVTLCPGTFTAGFGGFCRGFSQHLHPGIPCSARLLKSFDWPG